MDKNIDKYISKKTSDKYSKSVLITLKELRQMQLKLCKKKVIQKKAEATGDLIGNIITNKITKFQKNHKKLFQRQLQVSMIKKYHKKYIYLKKKGKKLLMN